MEKDKNTESKNIPEAVDDEKLEDASGGAVKPFPWEPTKTKSDIKAADSLKK